MSSVSRRRPCFVHALRQPCRAAYYIQCSRAQTWLWSCLLCLYRVRPQLWPPQVPGKCGHLRTEVVSPWDGRAFTQHRAQNLSWPFLITKGTRCSGWLHNRRGNRCTARTAADTASQGDGLFDISRNLSWKQLSWFDCCSNMFCLLHGGGGGGGRCSHLTTI